MLRRFAAPPPTAARHGRPPRPRRTPRWRRLPAVRAPGGLPRIAAFGLCAVLLGWTWWDARAGGYAGLPVNMLGQIIGDVLLMGLVAPIGKRAGGRERRRHPALMDVVARAHHRVQLLDLDVCLHPDLPGALASALGNDACVEILLPEPGAPGTPEDYPDRLRRLLEDLSTLHAHGAGARAGRLDVRLCGEPTAVSIIRCDGRVWVSLHPDRPASAAYLALDRDGENTRELRAYFDRLHAGARPPARDRPEPVGAMPPSGPGHAEGGGS